MLMKVFGVHMNGRVAIRERLVSTWTLAEHRAFVWLSISSLQAGGFLIHPGVPWDEASTAASPDQAGPQDDFTPYPSTVTFSVSSSHLLLYHVWEDGMCHTACLPHTYTHTDTCTGAHTHAHTRVHTHTQSHTHQTASFFQISSYKVTGITDCLDWDLQTAW